MRLSRHLWSIGSFLLIVVLWDLGVRLFHVPAYLVPAPIDVVRAFFENARQLGYHTLWTALTVLAGFLAAAIFAVPIAVLIASSLVAERLLYPPMVATQSIPKIALAPLFVVWFGFGIAPKVAVAFLIAFFPIVIDTIVGLRSMDPAMLQLARAMGAPSWRVFWKFSLPHALPSIFGGLKVASTLAVVGALTGEFIGSDKGLGYVLLQASGNLNTTLLFATLVALSVLARVFFYAVELIERIAIPWHVSQRAHPA